MSRHSHAWRTSLLLRVIGIGVAAALAAGTLSATSASSAGAATLPSTLSPGQSISDNQCMLSPQGKWLLCMLSNGDLEERANGVGPVVWSSGTSGHPCTLGPEVACNYLTMQSDGNLVIYGPTCTGLNHSCWYSGSSGNSAGKPYFAVQDDANLVVYVTWPQFRPVWDIHGGTPKTDPTYLTCLLPSLPGTVNWFTCEPSYANPELPGTVVFALSNQWQLSNGALYAWGQVPSYSCDWGWVKMTSSQITAVWAAYQQQERQRGRSNSSRLGCLSRDDRPTRYRRRLIASPPEILARSLWWRVSSR